MTIAGIDEVGRGCLIGPVVAAAVVLDAQHPIIGLMDSKKLSEKKRRTLAEQIKSDAIAWSIGRAEASEIDRINILQASLLAMKRAYLQLSVKADQVLVDGKHFPDIDCRGECVIQGDQKIIEISAASILAKVARDDEMETLDRFYPGYELLRHKGYPTRLHLQKLDELGVSEQHRKSFSPVKKRLS